MTCSEILSISEQVMIGNAHMMLAGFYYIYKLKMFVDIIKSRFFIKKGRKRHERIINKKRKYKYRIK